MSRKDRMRWPSLALSLITLIFFLVPAFSEPGASSAKPIYVNERLSEKNIEVLEHVGFPKTIAGKINTWIDPSEQEKRYKQSRLEGLVLLLKLFVKGIAFDNKDFEFRKKEIGIQLEEIQGWAPQLVEYREFFNMLNFAKIVYDAMVYAAESLTHYPFDDPEQVIVRDTILLYVGLWDLYDCQGQPDPRIHGFADTVKRITRILQYLGDVFKQLDKVHFESLITFGVYYRGAKSTLQYLESYIPDIGVHLSEDMDPELAYDETP